MSRLLPCLLVVCLLCLSACGRESTPAVDDGTPSASTAVEEARVRLAATPGGQRVLAAIEAHGGLEAWQAAPTSAFTWEYSNTPANLRFKSYQVVDNRSRQAYHDLLLFGTPENPQPVEGQFAWDGTDGWIAAPSVPESFNPRFWATTPFYFQMIPFVLADPGLVYEVLPDESLNGTLHPMVRVGFESGVGDAPDDTYTLYLDPETDQVRAIRYTVTYGRSVDPDASPRETLLTYEDYVTVDGLTVPTRFRGFTFVDGERGAPRSDAWADSLSFREPFEMDRLVRPPEARVAAAP